MMRCPTQSLKDVSPSSVAVGATLCCPLTEWLGEAFHGTQHTEHSTNVGSWPQNCSSFNNSVMKGFWG